MNLVLTLTRNNLALTERCIESILKQDVPASPIIFDNGSTDGTVGALSVWPMFVCSTNKGVSVGWNMAISAIFRMGHPHVLVVGNDTVLPPWFYRELLSYEEPFVTGVAVDTMEQIASPPTARHKEPHPDFSAFLITKECWDKVGPFDESMMLYSSDQDYHIRGWFAGVNMVKVPVPFYHERSSTLRLAPPDEHVWIHAQADRDRTKLREKWGVSAGGADYNALFSPENFGSQRVPSYGTNDKAT